MSATIRRSIGWTGSLLLAAGVASARPPAELHQGFAVEETRIPGTSVLWILAKQPGEFVAGLLPSLLAVVVGRRGKAVEGRLGHS